MKVAGSAPALPAHVAESLGKISMGMELVTVKGF